MTRCADVQVLIRRRPAELALSVEAGLQDGVELVPDPRMAAWSTPWLEEPAGTSKAAANIPGTRGTPVRRPRPSMHLGDLLRTPEYVLRIFRIS